MNDLYKVYRVCAGKQTIWHDLILATPIKRLAEALAEGDELQTWGVTSDETVQGWLVVCPDGSVEDYPFKAPR